jgi:Nif-specific regulatory protein
MESTEVNRLDSHRSPRVHLVVQRGAARLEVVDLSPLTRVTIGRSHTNRVVLPDSKCSRQHCEIYLQKGNWFLRDLGSRNGIMLGGTRVEDDHLLQPGDVFEVGSCLLRYTDRPTEAPPSGSDPRPAEPGFEIVERKSGTVYDGQSGVNRLQHRSDDASDLFRLARTMAASVTEEELCRSVLDGLVIHTGAAIGGVLLVPQGEDDPDLESLEPRALYGERPASLFSSFLTRVALDDQEAILAQDISQHASLASQKSLQFLQAESAICAPIRHMGHVLGVIHLYGLQGATGMTRTSLEFVLAVADQMGDQLHSLRERVQLETGLDRARQNLSDLQDQLEAGTELVGQSSRLEELRRAIARVSPTDALVLIRGESGVGKELVARAVHFNSQRKEGPFVCVNCAALTESLLESELFGHEKGAFTGASTRRAGKFEQAHGGTLFLDEIGEMSPEIQAKFLRVLEGQAFERVGGGEPITVDVRVVTATNRDLEEAVRQKKLRRDLFFRLQVIEIVVPPLRQHPQDIPSIAQHFLHRFAAQAHRRVRGFSSAALQKLQSHDWPGNVRELRNVVERAVILADREILGPEDLVLTKLHLDNDSAPGQFRSEGEGVNDLRNEIQQDAQRDGDFWVNFIEQKACLDDVDRLYIEAVLRSTEWNKSKASRILQIERTTLDRRLKKYGLARPGGENEDGSDSDGEID